MRYARVKDGIVREIMNIDEKAVPADKQVSPEVAAQLIQTNDINVIEGWLWDGNNFSAPAADPVPTKEELNKREITKKLTDWFYDELTHAQIITEVQKIKAG